MAKKKGQPNGRRASPNPTQTANDTLPFRIERFGQGFTPNPNYNPQPPKVLESDRRKHNPTRSISPLHPKAAARLTVKTANYARAQYLRAQLFTNSPVKYARRKAGISTLSERISFNAPKRLELCIRRAMRKQVMHAKKHAGKKGQKRPNRNFWSKISC